MDKKVIGIIAGIVAVIVIVLVVIFLVKGKMEEVKIPLQIDFLERTVSVNIGYPKGVTVEDSSWESSKVFKNVGKNYALDISLTEDTTYKNNKEYNAEEEGFEEIKIGNFSGYISKGTYDVEGAILLEELTEENAYIYLTFDLEPIESTVNDKDVDVVALYKSDEVQKILKSIKYNKGEETREATKAEIDKKEEEEKTSNYGEFKDRARMEGTSDKDGLVFIPSYESPNPELFRAEQRNDNVGVDNYLWYTSDNSSFDDSCIEVRIFPKTGTYSSMEEYIAQKGDMYHWTKSTIAGKEYDTYEFGSNPVKPAKFSDYFNGAFMVGDKVVEFSYSMFAEIPDQELGQDFFKRIVESIEYSKKFNE